MKSVWPKVRVAHPYYGSNVLHLITARLRDEILGEENLRTEVSVDNATDVITDDLFELLDRDVRISDGITRALGRSSNTNFT